MTGLWTLLNHIRAHFTLENTEINQPKTSGTQHEMTVETYTHEDGRRATVTFWDGLPAVINRPGMDEVTEGDR